MLIKLLLAVASVYVVGHWLAGVAVVVLFVIWALLKAEEGPPVLALALTIQWLQVSGGVFYSGLTGRTLPAIDTSDDQPMVLIGLGCVTALAVGLWLGIRFVRGRMARPDFAPEEVVGLKLLLIAYVATLVVTGVLQELAWRIPTLTQAILAISFAHLGLVFLILRRLTRPHVQGGYIVLLLACEIGLGFTGYFSNFKEPLLLAGLAVLEVFDRSRKDHWMAAGALTVTLVLASVMWMGVRTAYRQDFVDSVFATSRGMRLERMQALATDWLSNRDERAASDMDQLVDRSWAIYYPALAVARVPSVVPHSDGALLGGALYHLVTPRIFFPNKPDLPSDSELVRKYAGALVAGLDRDTSIAFGYADVRFRPSRCGLSEKSTSPACAVPERAGSADGCGARETRRRQPDGQFVWACLAHDCPTTRSFTCLATVGIVFSQTAQPGRVGGTMIAQAVAEYGLMEQMALGVQKTSYAVRGFISDAGPGTWIVIGLIALVVLWSLSKRGTG